MRLEVLLDVFEYVEESHWNNKKKLLIVLEIKLPLKTMFNQFLFKLKTVIQSNCFISSFAKSCAVHHKLWVHLQNVNNPFTWNKINWNNYYNTFILFVAISISRFEFCWVKLSSKLKYPESHDCWSWATMFLSILFISYEHRNSKNNLYDLLCITNSPDTQLWTSYFKSSGKKLCALCNATVLK